MRAANITRVLTTTMFLGTASPLIHGQGTEIFPVHGTPRSCSAITQLDSALSENSQQFFAGWNEKDYADAAAWSRACADYGWHIPGRPRLTLLQAQHDKALGAQSQSTDSATADASAAPPVQTAVAAQSASGTPVQADVAAPAPAPVPVPAPVVGAAPVATPTASVSNMASQAQAAGQEPLLSGAAPGIPLATPAAQTNLASQAVPATAVAAVSRGGGASDPEEDNLVTDEYFRTHFHQESLWVANRAHLDIGEDRGPSSWTTGGTSAQLKNRITADRMVLYCARKTNAAESNSRQPTEPSNRPLLWDWRWCESEEAAAYNRLVSGNEFPSAGRGVVLGCAGTDSYIYTERCIETLIESAKN
jgi:hypothetical protein